MKDYPEHPYVRQTRRKLGMCRGYWPVVAKKAGVSMSWIQKFGSGQLHNPTIKHLQATADACGKVLRKIARDEEVG